MTPRGFADYAARPPTRNVKLLSVELVDSSGEMENKAPEKLRRNEKFIG